MKRRSTSESPYGGISSSNHSKASGFKNLFPFLLIIAVSCGIFFLTRQEEAPKTGDEISDNWLSETQQRISADEYSIQPDEGEGPTGNFVSPNRANDMRFTYSPKGFEAKPRRYEDWQMAFEIESVRVNDETLTLQASPEIRMDGAVLRQKHESGVEVEYQNTASGMRQNFIIEEGPSGDAAFRVDLLVETDLKAINAKYNGVTFGRKGSEEPVYFYKDLKVFDADNRLLASHMEIRPGDSEGKYQVSLLASGSDLAYPVTIDPLNGAAWEVDGGGDTLRLGYSVAGAGDVNNDGFDDAIVGVINYDNGSQANAGQVRIYHGSGSGLSTTPAITINGGQGGGFLGFSVDGAGNVNGDDYDDVIIGAYLYDESIDLSDTLAGNLDRDEGAFFIYYGSGAGVTTAMADTVIGQMDTMRLGSSVSAAGDVNNDGFDDVIVGAYTFANGELNEGAAYVYEGSAGGLVTPALWSYEGGQVSGFFGYSVSDAGDVDNDGFDDVLVGAYGQYNAQDTGQGKAYLFLGGGSGPSGSPDWQKVGPHKYARFGISVSGAGNVNGDAFDDIVVGADRFSDPFLEVDTIVYDTNDITMEIDTLTVSGYSTGEGALFVYHGSGSGPSSNADWMYQSNSGQSGLGVSVASAGDVNNDGFDDIISGAPGYSDMEFDEGRAYAFYGSGSGLLPDTAQWIVESDVGGARFGISVDGLGDVDGDGVSDVIVGASQYDNNVAQALEGGAFAFYGIDGCGLPQYGDDPVFLTFPENITLETENGSCTASHSWDEPTFADNCPGASIMQTAGPTSGSDFSLGNTTVTYEVTNTNGNTTSQSFTVTVEDNQSPAIDNCEDYVHLIAPGESEGTVNFPDPSFTDNCPGALTIMQIAGDPSGTVFPLGVSQVQFSAVDAAGNSTSCTFRIIVIDTNDPGESCSAYTIEQTVRTKVPVEDDVEFRSTQSLFGQNGLLSAGAQPIGASILFKIIEGILGFDIPDWIEQLLGVGGGGIDLAFVSIDFGFTPGINMDFGFYNDLKDADSATIDINYPMKVCATFPAPELFGCRDTISISTSSEVLSDADLDVDPGMLNQEFGLFLEDLRVEIGFFLEVSACIGIPNPLPIGPDCVGYEASFDEEWSLFDPITLWEGTGDIPFWVICDEMFEDFAGWDDLFECTLGFNTSSDLEEVFAYADAVAGGAGLDGVAYNSDADQVTLKVPQILISTSPFPIPEFDFNYGRLTADDLGSTSVVGDKLVVSGTEDEFQRHRVDLLYIVDVIIWAATAGSSEIPPCIGLGTTIDLGCGFLLIDLGDVNMSMISSLEGDFEFDPDIDFDAINLEYPMAYNVNGGGWQGPSSTLTGVSPGDNIEIVIPDGVNDTIDVNNTYSVSGDLSIETTQTYSLGIGVKLLQIGGNLFGGNDVFTLLCEDPLTTIPFNSRTVQDQTLSLDFDPGGGSFFIVPDMTPPVVECQDTTVYLNEWGYATIDAEDVFVSGYDIPQNGTGEVIIIGVEPDTVTCDDYPGVDAILITEDGNCNFDTCELFINVLDTLKPYVTCQDYTVVLDEFGIHHLDPEEMTIGAIDNCSFIELHASDSTFTCADVGVDSIFVTITGYDIANNFDTCSAIVTVLDTLPPLFECPFLDNYPVTRNTDPGFCTYTANSDEFEPDLLAPDCNTVITWELTGATIASGMTNVGGVSFNLGTTTVTYTATDASGNATVCSFDVIVIDEEDPVITCPADVVIGTNDDGANDYNCTTDYTWTHPAPTDNCSVVFYEVEYTFPDGSTEVDDLLPELNSGMLSETRTFDIGITNLEYTVIDTAGNTVGCSWSITVVDDEDPMVFCEQVISCIDYTITETVDIVPNDQTIVPIEVANEIVITDVNLNIDGSITDMGNLTVSLQSPTGTVVVLADGLCGGSNTFDVTFNDDAGTNVTAAPCPLSGEYQSQSVGMAGFNGEQSGGFWLLIFDNANTDGCGLLADVTLEVCGNDATGEPVIVALESDPGLCSFKILDGSLDPPFTDNCEGSTMVHDAIMGPFDNTLQGAVLPVGETVVTWTVTDASGNTTSCQINYIVRDNEDPVFVNCPRPDIIEDAEPGVCGAYVNFSPPIAEDNCGVVTVSQIDQTGLSTGSVFPVGMTILDYMAVDPSGNSAVCSLRVIVNDTQDPILVCPQSLEQATDPWVCEAVVNDIAPLQAADNCPDNFSVVYQIEYPAGSGEITGGGVADASGEVFQNGTSTVHYRLQDQPVLLISEVTHEIGILNGGMNPEPYTVLTGNDYMEITNIGPAAYNISELVIERFGTGQDETLVLPNGTIVNPGETVVIHFGNGDDDPGNLFFNIPCAADLTTGAQAGYAISFKGRTLDAVAVNGFDPVGQATQSTVTPADWTGSIDAMNGKGGVYRLYSYDNNNASDWAVADVCMPITIGSLNPTLEAYAWNGAVTALQSIAPNTESCNFNVVIYDEETPTCGEYIEHIYAGNGGLIEDGLILQSTVNVADNFTVGDVDLLNLVGNHTNMGDLVFKITSPEGTQVILFGGLCEGGADFDLNIDEDSSILVNNAPCNPLGQGGWYVPANSLTAFYGEPAMGNWTLEIADTAATNTGNLIDWDLRLFEIAGYSQTDTTLNNDPGFCGAVFDWTHPRLVDNCREGEIEVVYLTDSFINVPEGGIIVGGSPASEYFEVGETIVRYILTDAAGNVDSCEFLVTVLDVEDPVVVCPNDIIINLGGGECRTIVDYNPLSATDNCAVVDTIMTPPSGSWFEIGETEVEIIVIDSSGNADTCYFNVIVNEYVPTSGTLSCNDLVNVSLDSDCEEEITADMILEGDDYHCYEDYQITVLGSDGFPIPTSPIVTLDYIGQTLTVMVYDPDTGNTCWGSIYIEDHQSPIIECPADTVVFCHINTDPANMGFPELLSCELSFTTEHNDVFNDFGNCSDPRGEIIRTWTLTDESGNESACEQTITIERIDFVDVAFPENYDGNANPVFACTEVAANPGLTSPTNTGQPTVDGLPVTGGALCSVAINYVDNVFEICEGSYDILRTWSVYDPCEPVVAGVNPLQFLQVIKVLDDAAPILTCPSNMVANAGNGDCTANVQIPVAGIEDACSSVSITTDTPNGTLNSNGGLLTDVEIGEHTITYFTVDDCGNTSSCSFILTVEDQTAPVAICDEITEVSLTSDGQGVAFAETFDDGSYDNCELAYFEVSRMDGDCNGDPDDFGPSVTFCCNDVPNNPIMVVFRAYDIYGNFNDCMVQVEVQDKLPPFVVTCPAPQTISCETYVEELSVPLNLGDYSVLDPYGDASFYDNCELEITYEVTLNIDECQAGTVVRTWTANDNSGFNPPAVCTQTITVEHNSDWVVEFPADILVECTDGQLPEFGEPEIYFDECELIGISFEDEYFYVVPDACYKIVRTWSAINWCVYNDFGYDAFSEEDHFESVYFSDWDGDGDQDDRTFRDGWNDSGAPGTPDGYISYEQVIKVNDSEAPEFVIPTIDGCIVEEDCDKDLTIPYPDILDECSVEFEVNISGDFGDFDDIQASVVVPDVVPGTYDITYTVTDNCGNTSFETTTVVVEDCKLPTPYCLNGLVVEIMQTGMIEVWASDLNLGSFDNCPGDLIYTFSPDITDLAVTYTCDDLGQQAVEIWVTDAAGNQDFCETFINVQDNMNNCDPNPVTVDIAGLIATEELEPVEYVEVEVNGTTTLSEVTEEDGLFLFNVMTGGDYTVTPMRDDNPLNGVTTYDLVIMSLHILGLDPLDSPYQMIAADANNSGTVTTLDMVEIRKLILLIETDFPNNTSWRFVDADYVFPNPMNPWEEVFPEAISFNNLILDELETDFVGIKIGDLNGSVVPNDMAEVDDRDPIRDFWLETDDLVLEAGTVHEIPFYVGPDMIWGVQYTLAFNPDAMEFVEMKDGLSASENLGTTKADEGYLTFSWNAHDEAVSLEEGTLLHSLRFRIRESVKTSEVFNISYAYTWPEAYDANGDLLSLGLRFGDQAESSRPFALYQSHPNPFRQETRIGFELPESCHATMRIMDAGGREVYRFDGDFKAGYNELYIREGDLKIQSGIMYYELITPTHRAVRKMVRIE
ncbi:MAG: HYR domain-containing protein [Bacteroidetes bacterium]|nr:HYR domain-containing protein [Bacteroidota bacterium]